MTDTADVTERARAPGGHDPPEGHEAAEMLASARRRVGPELRTAVASLPEALRRVALPSLGWGHADGTPTLGGAGAAAGPALVLAAVRALGGDPGAAARAAAAVELTHGRTRLHDGVLDRATARGGRPGDAVPGEVDVILAGDALQAVAQRLLAEDPHPGAPAAAVRLAACVVELCAARHAERVLEGRRCAEVSAAEWIAVAEAGAGALLGCACAIGAVYAGAGPEVADALDGFGRQAGLAFRLIDDVIGIWGDPARTGGPARAVLAAPRKPLPVVAALASGTPDGAALVGLYDRGPGERDPERVARAVERAGGRDWAQTQAADRMSRALGELARAVPDPERAGGLLALVEFLTRRPC
ncbi:polyprenyl synthetase [Streptomyces longispororuber]|uniref:Polyprenyl synthetase n=1 Tax=Streptomyces longispororuber TaxID=68230 RepID=A0A919A2Z5_9ACTN|nr:polyprenyl synthetase family protein [Streptomyces longispororuber]GHE85023.1 polyprenyl synthetase [Streptomyces longispororuber]